MNMNNKVYLWVSFFVCILFTAEQVPPLAQEDPYALFPIGRKMLYKVNIIGNQPQYPVIYVVSMKNVL